MNSYSQPKLTKRNIEGVATLTITTNVIAVQIILGSNFTNAPVPSRIADMNKTPKKFDRFLA
jgi:hypothetical protein